MEKKKLNLLGDQAVGKTSLVIRYVENKFGDEYLKTIGTNIYIKDVELPTKEVKLIVQDIMGETSYATVQKGAFQNSSGAIAVVDITNTETLESVVNDWIPKYKEIAGEKPIFLAVNKCDLNNKEITFPYLKEKNYLELFEGYLFTSAKTGQRTEELFKEIAFNSAYKINLEPSQTIEEIVGGTEIKTTNDLVDCVLAFSSEFMVPYEKREEILKQSGIDKYKLEEEIPESAAMFFASSMSYYCYENIHEKIPLRIKGDFIKKSNIFLELVKKYLQSQLEE